jgi:type VI protein secretion system component VasK
MIAFLKRIFKQPSQTKKQGSESLPTQTLLALRQLNQGYQRQKRLWVYIILSALTLMIVYVMFSIFWAGLRVHAIPIAWIILAGIVIAVLQVRRCNDLIFSLRQAYQVQQQIEKAQAEREAQEKARQEEQETETPQSNKEKRPPISSNGSQKPSDLPDMQP